MKKKNMEAQFNRTYISMLDFIEAEKYLQEFDPTWSGNATLSDNLKRALLVAAITAYARPFSGNSNHDLATNAPPLDPKKVLKEQWAFELHENILRLRHAAIAHSDYEMKAAAKTVSLNSGFVVQVTTFDILSEMIDVEYFRGMCILMHKYCLNKLFELEVGTN
jgi:hypothetical protein